ncbi:hypothetical protein F2Q70_00042141 [Brassica cretica]|uniref:Uncharacterized protein n=1 Tax=Brassica cretica TaxID=69181 RepID=A0A8S9JZU8_BRACR|nr:hypothetical protein F2Q70_00042141 [Brassica cretica]KAF2619787.1 hypothetical protein F2Q68_00042813 [Brassica cretica]
MKVSSINNQTHHEPSEPPPERIFSRLDRRIEPTLPKEIADLEFRPRIDMDSL